MYPHLERGGAWKGGRSRLRAAPGVYDQQPLGPRLPTRLWYSGADSEIWHVPLPTEHLPWQYRLHRHICTGPGKSARQQLDGRWLDARVRLGALTIGNT